MENRVTYTVYYEDTDSLGVVYYANYLKYLERGRTEFIGQLGRDVWDWNAAGYYFVVHSMTIHFRKAAGLGDRVEVVSSFELLSDFRGRFHQRIERDGERIVDADVDVVCLGTNRMLQEYPAFFGRFKNGS